MSPTSGITLETNDEMPKTSIRGEAVTNTSTIFAAEEAHHGICPPNPLQSMHKIICNVLHNQILIWIDHGRCNVGRNRKMAFSNVWPLSNTPLTLLLLAPSSRSSPSSFLPIHRTQVWIASNHWHLHFLSLCDLPLSRSSVEDVDGRAIKHVKKYTGCLIMKFTLFYVFQMSLFYFSTYLVIR